MTAAKWPFGGCGSWPPRPAMIGNANVGPNAMIAPRHVEEQEQLQHVSTLSIDASVPASPGVQEAPGGLYDTRRVRRWTKSTRTYSPRRSGSA